MNHQKVTLAVECICELGCTSVHATIEALESGQNLETVRGFSDAEVIALTHELKAIMAVYDEKDK